jgi:hypothetical protein
LWHLGGNFRPPPVDLLETFADIGVDDLTGMIMKATVEV